MKKKFIRYLDNASPMQGHIHVRDAAQTTNDLSVPRINNQLVYTHTHTSYVIKNNNPTQLLKPLTSYLSPFPSPPFTSFSLHRIPPPPRLHRSNVLLIRLEIKRHRPRKRLKTSSMLFQLFEAFCGLRFGFVDAIEFDAARKKSGGVSS